MAEYIIDPKLLRYCLVRHDDFMDKLKKAGRLPNDVGVSDFSKAVMEEYGEALEVFILACEFDNILKFLMKKFGRALAESKYHWWRGSGSEVNKYKLLLEVGDMLHFVFSIALKSSLHMSFPRADIIIHVWDKINTGDKPMALLLSTISGVIRSEYMSYEDMLAILKSISDMFNLNVNDMLVAYLVKNKVNIIRIENNWDKSKDPDVVEMLDKALCGEEPVVVDYYI